MYASRRLKWPHPKWQGLFYVYLYKLICIYIYTYTFFVMYQLWYTTAYIEIDACIEIMHIQCVCKCLYMHIYLHTYIHAQVLHGCTYALYGHQPPDSPIFNFAFFLSLFSFFFLLLKTPHYLNFEYSLLETSYGYCDSYNNRFHIIPIAWSRLCTHVARMSGQGLVFCVQVCVHNVHVCTCTHGCRDMDLCFAFAEQCWRLLMA